MDALRIRMVSSESTTPLRFSCKVLNAWAATLMTGLLFRGDWTKIESFRIWSSFRSNVPERKNYCCTTTQKKENRASDLRMHFLFYRWQGDINNQLSARRIYFAIWIWSLPVNLASRAPTLFADEARKTETLRGAKWSVQVGDVPCSSCWTRRFSRRLSLLYSLRQTSDRSWWSPFWRRPGAPIIEIDLQQYIYADEICEVKWSFKSYHHLFSFAEPTKPTTAQYKGTHQRCLEHVAAGK